MPSLLIEGPSALLLAGWMLRLYPLRSAKYGVHTHGHQQVASATALLIMPVCCRARRWI